MLFLTAAALPAYAQRDQHRDGGNGRHVEQNRGHEEHRGGNGWIGPAIGLGVGAAILGGAVAGPYYYDQPAPQVYYPPQANPLPEWLYLEWVPVDLVAWFLLLTILALFLSSTGAFAPRFFLLSL